MSAHPHNSTTPVRPHPIEMVKYSLPELLAELKLERATGTLAMEKLQQADIGNLFQSKQRRRRGKPE
ncbi:MAG: hypothetical protein QM715_16535 [Nibricoccus sp.]